jgi:hypothetical protein
MEWRSPARRGRGGWGPVRAAQRSRGGVRREMMYDDAIRDYPIDMLMI